MEQNFLLRRNVPKRLHAARIAKPYNIKRLAFHFSVTGKHPAGYVLVFCVQIKDKTRFRRQIAAELFRLRFRNLHHILQLRQNTVIKIGHMIPAHMKRKCIFSRQICQPLYFLQKITFYLVETAVFNIICRIGSKIKGRQNAVYFYPMKITVALGFVFRNIHDYFWVLFCTGKQFFLFSPAVLIFIFYRMISQFPVKLV